MKTKPIILFLLLYAVVTQGQINFAKGYFITNEGSRIECFIRNYHWKKSPEEIKYRLSDTGTIRIITEKSNGLSKFIKYSYQTYNWYIIKAEIDFLKF